jgi:hypothetical protein
MQLEGHHCVVPPSPAAGIPVAVLAFTRCQGYLCVVFLCISRTTRSGMFWPLSVRPSLPTKVGGSSGSTQRSSRARTRSPFTLHVAGRGVMTMSLE